MGLLTTMAKLGHAAGSEMHIGAVSEIGYYFTFDNVCMGCTYCC